MDERGPPRPELREILSRVAKARAELIEVEAELAGLAAVLPSATGVDLAAVAKGLYAARRLRSRYLPDAMFAEPAWDILLDLYVARHEGRSTTTTSACAASAASPSTGLRWLVKLERRGMIVRRTAPGDTRLTLVEISPDAFSAMTDYLLRLSVGR